MRAPLALTLAAFALAGCAKFPDNAGANFTRLRFDMTYAGDIPVDTQYVYAVAIQRILRTTTNEELSFGPEPVFDIGSKNGYVEGRPTHVILFSPESTNNYLVYAFQRRTPTENDPNPIELAAPVTIGDVITGSDPLSPEASSLGKRSLGFEISTQDLARGPNGQQEVDPADIIGIQFNIISTNLAATTSGAVASRVMDAFGDTNGRTDPTTISIYRRLDIISGNIIGNDRPGTTAKELEGDTYAKNGGRLPAVDLVDWSVEVRTN